MMYDGWILRKLNKSIDVNKTKVHTVVFGVSNCKRD